MERSGFKGLGYHLLIYFFLSPQKRVFSQEVDQAFVVLGHFANSLAYTIH